MTGSASIPPGFYRPVDVARMLRCSAWWVKEQARRGRIPYCWIGGGYLFTAEHVAEIVRLFEVLPTEAAAPAPALQRASRRPSGVDSGPVVQLNARTPRRARVAATRQAA